jgi:hypothetical protein
VVNGLGRGANGAEPVRGGAKTHIFCIGGKVDHARTLTDEKGRFQFSGRIRGWYEVVVRCPHDNPFVFAAHRNLDELQRGEYTTYLEYSTAHCD